MDENKSLQDLQSLPAQVDKYEKLKGLSMPYEPFQVKKAALTEMEEKKDVALFNSAGDSPITRAMTLREFDNGLLMSLGLTDVYQTLATQLSLDLQKEYKCNTSGKKSLAEIASLNYCRVLETQRRMNSFLSKDSYGELTVKILSILSKEQDRAQRHYLTSMQSLEMGLQPAFNFSIKTNTANFASQQAIQQVGEQTNVKG